MSTAQLDDLQEQNQLLTDQFSDANERERLLTEQFDDADERNRLLIEELKEARGDLAAAQQHGDNHELDWVRQQLVQQHNDTEHMWDMLAEVDEDPLQVEMEEEDEEVSETDLLG